MVPIPDEEFGCRPVAYLKSDFAELDLHAIRKGLETVLPKFKIPVAFYPWPEEFDEERMKIDRSYFQKLACRRSA